MGMVVQYVLYLGILIILAVPLGGYIKKVLFGEKNILSKFLMPCEKFIYRMVRVDETSEMSWKLYLFSIIIFSIFGFFFTFLLQVIQGILPGNPQGYHGVRWDLAFNTAVSFVTNTNWQAYSGESTMSYLVQAGALTVQNFLSAAAGISVLFAVTRGFVRIKNKGLGNFWVDITRVILYILLPLSILCSLLLIGGGVVQNWKPSQSVTMVEPVAATSEGKIIKNAVVKNDKVMVGDKVIKNAQIIKKQFIPMGPAASQVAIKQLGTNGGGFMGTNSAHPFENPNAFTNMVEMLSILLIPMALCFTFGKAVQNKKQGIAIFAAMFICLVLALGVMAYNEQSATPQLAQHGAVNLSNIQQAGGNMEGKETRFGIASSVLWSTFTTAASNGSVNAMQDSLTPMGGFISMILIQSGEVIFGGVGSGLYGMISFAILTVFIAGLMVGRTPEFLGKKIEPYEMKWSVMVCLATPVAILVGSTIAAMLPNMTSQLSNTGAHGFSELLYAYSSAGGNNGSAFAGFRANTSFLNVSLALVMIFARFLPIIGTLAIAGSLSKKKKIATTVGTLSTSNGMFVFMLVLIVMLIGALSFFPALALGPLAEFFSKVY